MKHPIITLTYILFAAVLGFAATTEERSRQVVVETPIAVAHTIDRGFDRVYWEYIEFRAKLGDPCSIYLTGAQRLRSPKEGLTRRHMRYAEWYTGLEPDPVEARRRILNAADMGCEYAKIAAWNLRLRSDPGDLQFLNGGREFDWNLVRTRAVAGDPDARYWMAMSMKSTPRIANQRGFHYDPVEAERILRELTRAGYFRASLELWQDQPGGITPELKRSYEMFVNGNYSPRDGYAIHQRYMSDAIAHCRASSYRTALDLFESIKHQSNHKIGEVLTRMKEYSRKCERK
jgi:hypothetical protein